MREKKRKYKDQSSVEFLLLRDKLGFQRYRKQMKRDKEERRILIDLGLKKILEKEDNDFILIGYKRRKLEI